MSCEPWAIASSRPDRAITGSALRILPFLKRVPRPSGANPQGPPQSHAHRAVVAGRSPCRPADQAHPALGKAWHPPLCAEGSAPVLGMDLRSDLPCRRQGCRHRHAQVQQRSHEHASRGDRLPRRAGCACRPPARSGRMARIGRTGRASQYNAHAAATQMPGTQSGRKRLAVHARQLAVEPHLQILRRHRRPLLLRLEQACRSALAHHDLGATLLGAQVLISESWYKTVVVIHGYPPSGFRLGVMPI